MYPCHYFYSRFHPDLQHIYIYTMFCFAFVGLTMFLYSWIIFDKKANYQLIFQ